MPPRPLIDNTATSESFTLQDSIYSRTCRQSLSLFSVFVRYFHGNNDRKRPVARESVSYLTHALENDVDNNPSAKKVGWPHTGWWWVGQCMHYGIDLLDQNGCQVKPAELKMRLASAVARERKRGKNLEVPEWIRAREKELVGPEKMQEIETLFHKADMDRINGESAGQSTETTTTIEPVVADIAPESVIPQSSEVIEMEKDDSNRPTPNIFELEVKEQTEDVIVQQAEISFSGIRRTSKLYRPPNLPPVLNKVISPEPTRPETQSDDEQSLTTEDDISNISFTDIPLKDQELNYALKTWNIQWRSTGISRNKASIGPLEAARVKGVELVVAFQDRLAGFYSGLPETSDAAVDWLLDRQDEIRAKLEYTEYVLRKLIKSKSKSERRRIAYAEKRSTKAALNNIPVGTAENQGTEDGHTPQSTPDRVYCQTDMNSSSIVLETQIDNNMHTKSSYNVSAASPIQVPSSSTVFNNDTAAMSNKPEAQPISLPGRVPLKRRDLDRSCGKNDLSILKKSRLENSPVT